jgi:hypothetical protein
LSEKHDIVECLCCSLCFEKCKCGSCVSLDCVMDFGSEMAMLDMDNWQFLKISHFLPVFEAGYYYCKYGSMLYRSTCIINNNDIYMIQ